MAWAAVSVVDAYFFLQNKIKFFAEQRILFYFINKIKKNNKIKKSGDGERVSPSAARPAARVALLTAVSAALAGVSAAARAQETVKVCAARRSLRS